MVITIKDEDLTGKIIQELELEFAEQTVSIKDIITQRVLKEVKNHNERPLEYFNGFVKPSDAEQTINGYRLKKKKEIDGEKQVYVALDAFMKNGYFVLVDNIQSESLEQKVQLSKDTNVSFIKLTPLVGG